MRWKVPYFFLAVVLALRVYMNTRDLLQVLKAYKYFVGGGGMLGFGTGKNSETSFALRLTGGVDYKFEDAPIDCESWI